VRKAGVNPILIPYLDAAGECFLLRPHKDNVRRPDGIDDLDEDYCGLHVYCAHLLRVVGMSPPYSEEHKNFCVITEGEFKALALIQAGIPAVAVPGIQQIQNSVFRERLVTLLRNFGKTDVVICFDNECKDDPAYPKYYKADEWKRVDTVVYARLTAQKLYQCGIARTRIAYLPDDWRVEGKADWDGALSTFVKEAGGIAKGAEKARRDFLRVLKTARYDKDCRDLFAGNFQRLVEAKLVKLNHVRQCPIGGDEEMSLGRRIRKLQSQSVGADEAYALGHAFINVVGKHYERKPRRWKDEELAAVKKSRDIAKAEKNWLLHRYYEELLAGYPDPISNCAIRCQYRLITVDGKMHYLLTVHTVNREETEQHLRISGEQLCRPAELHNWLITYAKAAWMGGIKSTQRLVADIQADSAHREIHEVESYGYSEYCDLWKFGDRAFTADGKTILPDENMVFWHNGIGFQTDFSKVRMGDGFKMGAPALGELDVKLAVESFVLLHENLFAAIGDYDAWLALGQILSYAAHPEIFRAYKGAPGLWFVGPKGSGKSTIAEWLVQIWGFPLKPFPSLTQGTTQVGVTRELAKYGCLPIPFDEFDALRTDPRVQSSLKNAFGRVSDTKGTFDSSKRTRSVEPTTTPFVLGENSSSEPATRSRYVNISVLEERATGDKKKRLRVMNAAAPNFRHIIHFIMQNRTEFVAKTMARLAAWVADPAIAKFITDQRQIFVSGAPFAAFMSVAELLQKHATGDMVAEFDEIMRHEVNFRTFAMQHGAESEKEGAEASFLMVFWTEIKTILEIGAVSHFRKFFHLKYARLDPKKHQILEEFNAPQDGLTPIMYLAPNPVYMLYEQDQRRSDKKPRLSMRDLRSELRRQRYWVNPPDNATHSHRVTFPGHGRETGCWCFDLSEHPLGGDFIELLRQDSEKLI
jgi:hypothetical protein